MAPTDARTGALDALELGLLALAAPFLLFPTVAPASTLLALAALPLIWLLRGALTRRLLPKTPLNATLVLWLLAVAAGVLVSADPDLTLPKAAGLLLGITLWRTLVVQVRTETRRRLAVVLFLLTAAGMIAAGALAVDWRAKLPFLEGVMASLPDGVLRLPETAPAGVHSNQLAGTILLAWPLSLALVAAAWRARRPPVSAPERGIALAAGGVALAGAGLLVLTQSRAGWLGALAGLGALVWLSRGHPAESTPAQRRRRLIFATLAGGLVVGALPLAGGWASAQVAAGTGGALETVAFRLEVWRYALEAIGDFPFTGTGLGAFRRVVLRLYPITAYPNPDVAHAHNIFLQVALDTGLPGLAAYLGLLWAVAAESRRRLRATGGEGAAQALGVLATLAAFHVFGLADAIAPGAKPGLLFWWLLGLAVAPGEAEGPRAAQPAPPPG